MITVGVKFSEFDFFFKCSQKKKNIMFYHFKSTYVIIKL